MTWPPKRSEFAVALGRLILDARSGRGLTQADVAANLGVGPEMVSRYERGVAQPDAEKLVALIHMLDLDLEQLRSEVAA